MPREFDVDEPELMDRPQPVSAELECDLANLASLNRWYGSHRLARHFLRRWLRPGGTYRVLDLCTGAGDLPRVMVDFARAQGIRIFITALDANPASLEIARRRCAGYSEIEFAAGDAMTFPAAGYDLIHCSLALHHFSEGDAIALLRRCRESSARWVLVSDLERAWFTTLGVWLLTVFFYREPMTRADARTSARRAFSFSELKNLASAAGWRGCSQERFAFCRQAVWLERDAL